MNSPNISILAPSDDHVVSDGDHGVHTVRMTGKLVRVEPVLVLAEDTSFRLLMNLRIEIII